jgi:hypothetical protein
MRTIAGIVLWGTVALSGPAAPHNVNVAEFRVLYDGQKNGYYASSGGAVLSGKKLELDTPRKAGGLMSGTASKAVTC